MDQATDSSAIGLHYPTAGRQDEDFDNPSYLRNPDVNRSFCDPDATPYVPHGITNRTEVNFDQEFDSETEKSGGKLTFERSEKKSCASHTAVQDPGERVRRSPSEYVHISDRLYGDGDDNSADFQEHLATQLHNYGLGGAEDPGSRNKSFSQQDDSLESVALEEAGVVLGPEDQAITEQPWKGLENEAYDGDAETDLSQSFQGGTGAPGFCNRPDPFPMLQRSLSGRYLKNPSLERKKPAVAKGPYDPQIGVYLTPPVSSKKDTNPKDSSSVRKRIPQPPSSLQMKCAFFWSCLGCLVGNFLCAIPALRYAVTASESKKIGDYNSANAYLRKTAILAILAIVFAIGGWTIVILAISGVF